MNLLTVKLLRDLRASWSRMVLMVVAIAVSLTVFGGVLYAWSASGRQTRAAYSSTEPASATILLDRPVGAGQLGQIAAEVRRRPGVLAATMRTQFESEVEVGGAVREAPVQLFVAMPDDPLAMVRFFPGARSWPPAPDEVFLTADSLAVLDVAVGDTISVDGPDGRRLRLRVADTVYDPSLSPAAQEQTGRGYLSASALAASGTAGLDQLKIQVAGPDGRTPSRDRDTNVDVAGAVARWAQTRYGVTIREIQVPRPYAHPHQWQADSLLLSLLTGGAVALLLSAILVANMLGNLFTRQIPQIGIMKALGAGSGRIARRYLAMTLSVAGAATLLAIGPAILIGRAAVGAFLGFLGIQATGLGAPWWTYVVIVATGLGLAPLIALVPLARTSRTTVRAAIDHHGLSAKPGTATGLLGRLGRLGRLDSVDRGLVMALRNTVRRPARFALAVLLLASAGMVFVAGMSLSASVRAVAADQKTATSWDVDVQLAGDAPMGDVTAALAGLPGSTRVEGFTLARTGVAGAGQVPVTRTYPDQGHGRTVVTAIPADATLFPTPQLSAGRWLRRDETGTVVLNQTARRNTLPDVEVGDTVQLLVSGKTTSWRVVGLAEERGGGSNVYTSAAGLAAATGQPARVTTLRIATAAHDEPSREQVASGAATALTRAGIDVKAANSVSRAQDISAGHLGPIVTIVLIIAMAMGLVGAIGLASTMSSNVLDRTREFGVLHAIGARPAAVRRIVVAEGVFLAITSCLVAVIPTLVLTALLGSGLGNLFFSTALPYRVSALGVGIWTALVILSAALATDAAATRASRITVREALATL